MYDIFSPMAPAGEQVTATVESPTEALTEALSQLLAENGCNDLPELLGTGPVWLNLEVSKDGQLSGLRSIAINL